MGARKRFRGPAARNQGALRFEAFPGPHAVTREKTLLHHDIRAIPVTAADAESVMLLDRAVEGFVSHSRETAGLLGAVLERDPDNVAALALRGLAQLLLGRWETVIAATSDCALALAALARRGGTARERGLVAALRVGIGGDLPKAAASIEAIVADNPHDLLGLKLGHALRFLYGDARGMRLSTEAALLHWEPDMPGYGYLLGCHAFGLEETGAFDEALAAGRCAVELSPRDAWGMHAVAHVHEMRGEIEDGLAWLGRHRGWASAHCNNFRFHIAWHEGLLQLERGDIERVLALYDQDVRPLPTDDYRDVANAASLLARLEQHGVAVGPRWEELADIAEARIEDMTLTFASLHYLVALLGARRIEPAERLVARIRDLGAERSSFQGHIAGAIGSDLADTLRDVALARVAGIERMRGKLERLPGVGGSHSQRDLFLRTLMHAAASAGRVATLAEVHSTRRKMKADDRFLETTLESLAGRLSVRESARATV